MNIKGKFVTLRAMEEKDQELLREMVNDPEIERMVGGYSFPISMQQQMDWYKNSLQTTNELRLIIETDNGEAVGYANIFNINWKNRSAFHGIKISNKRNRQKGIGTDTVMAVMRYAFEELNLNRLDGAIVDYNEGSKKLYCDKCGWKVEGIKRKAIFKTNAYHDELVVGILREDYLELIKGNNYWDE